MSDGIHPPEWPSARGPWPEVNDSSRLYDGGWSWCTNAAAHPDDNAGYPVGLRLAEAAALRPQDIYFMRGIVSPAIQWPAEPLKSEISIADPDSGRVVAHAFGGRGSRRRGDSCQ